MHMHMYMCMYMHMYMCMSGPQLRSADTVDQPH
jgi:hypothetical protein